MKRTRCSAVAIVAALAVAGCSSDRTSNPGPGPGVTFAPVPGAASATTSGSTSSSAAITTTAPVASAGAATEPSTVSSGPAASTTPASTDGSAAPSTTAGAPGAAPSASIVEFATVPDPVGIAIRPGDARLFAITQGGWVVPVAPDGTAGGPLLDVSSLTEADGERGLLGLAFHPTDPLAYVDYTAADTGDSHIDEFTVAADGTFDPASRREVLVIAQPYANHNGGQLVFGPDGDLYIGMGDGGSSGDPQRRALNVGELLGKILRIDPRRSGAQPYTSPADNPFAGVTGARAEIWSLGLRNPFRFSFDPATKDLWIADVGQDEWEEVDVAWAADGAGQGANFGWSAFEGNHRFNDDQPTTAAVAPIHEYEHGDAGCSISGGARYRGAAVPSLQGWYVYGDYCSGQVRAVQILDRDAGSEVLLGTPGGVSSVAAGADGELYVTSVANSTIYKITNG